MFFLYTPFLYTSLYTKARSRLQRAVNSTREGHRLCADFESAFARRENEFMRLFFTLISRLLLLEKMFSVMAIYRCYCNLPRSRSLMDLIKGR